jgi:NADH-quinone oxidoreductase subunit N
MSESYFAVFRGLSAEVVLVITALFALGLDLGWLRRHEKTERTKAVGVLTITGLLLAAIPVCQMLGTDPERWLGGTLVVDNLTLTFKLVILVLTLLTVVISLDYDLGRHVGEYFATVIFGAIGMMLLVASEELITIFVALELTSLCLYILTAFHKSWLRSQEAALKYFLFGAISSAFLLFGLSYVFGVAGTTNLRAMAELTMTPLLGVGLLLVIIGFGFKVAVVPFHLWAPDAYEGAPTPVTAFIATGSKVASFFVLAKVLLLGFATGEGRAFWGQFESGWTLLLAVTAVLSMVLGNCAAIVQRNVKRLLAYSSIAHAGYIFVGLIAASLTGATAVMFYVVVYALTNLGAFGVVAALAERAGGEELTHFNGMAKRAPWLSLLMLIFVLSLAGVPPLGGFFGKFYLFAAALEKDAQQFGLLWLVVIGILMSAVSLYYYLIVLKHMYVETATDESPIKTSGYLAATLTAVALAVVGLGVYPQPTLTLLNNLLARVL